MANRRAADNPVSIRTDLRPGDLGAVVRMHGVIYSREPGFDPTFEAYVAGPLAESVRRGSPRERLRIAEWDSRLIGSNGIVDAGENTAQLRWFLVLPDARGQGLGQALLREALAFARTTGYRKIMLWTVSVLTAAARLYAAAGFRLVAAQPGHVWGVDVGAPAVSAALGGGPRLISQRGGGMLRHCGRACDMPMQIARLNWLRPAIACDSRKGRRASHQQVTVMHNWATRREFLNRFVGGAVLACGWTCAAERALFGAGASVPAGVPSLTTISGSPRERGLAYGAQFRDGIGQFLDREIYGAFLGKPATRREMLDYATACARVVQEYCPIVFEEVGGVAAGAGILPQEVVLLALHEEFYHRGPLPSGGPGGLEPALRPHAGEPGANSGHCTAVAVGPPETVDGRTYVGQTWDWMQSVCGLSAIVEWRRDEGPSVLAYGFPGLWTGAGMNSAGIALCWTSANLEQKGLAPRVGVPSYLLIAHLLYQDSLDAAFEQARLDRHAGWFTFVMGDGEGRLASVEGSTAGVAVEELTGQLVRVGYGTRKMTATAEGQEVRRHPRCLKMSDHIHASSGSIDLRWLQNTFEDPACGISVGKSTIDMLAFDTTRKVACLSRGPAYGAAWREFQFSQAGG